ncbi:MAG: hypothetical protein QW035_00400 [Candidatus Anstonellales archaeon]
MLKKDEKWFKKFFKVIGKGKNKEEVVEKVEIEQMEEGRRRYLGGFWRVLGVGKKMKRLLRSLG